MSKKHQKLRASTAYPSEEAKDKFKAWCAAKGLSPFAMIRALIVEQLKKWDDSELERD